VLIATLSPTGKALELAALLILTDPFSHPVPCTFLLLLAMCACILGPSLQALDCFVQLCAQGGCWPHRTGHTGYDFARRRPFYTRCLHPSRSCLYLRTVRAVAMSMALLVVVVNCTLLFWMSVVILRFDNKRVNCFCVKQYPLWPSAPAANNFSMFTRTGCGDEAAEV